MPKYIIIQSKYLADDAIEKLPFIEFAYGSLGLSRRQAMIELGFPEEEIDNLLEERLAEDLIQDPRVREVMSDYLAKAMADPKVVAIFKEKDGQGD